MGSVTQKRCTACGKLHPMTAMRCSCGARLIDAPTVVVNIPEPSSPLPVDQPTLDDRWKCDACQFEQNRESDSICQLCEHPRELPMGDHAAGTEALATSYVLRFPFGDVSFTANLAIGRDPTFCNFSERLQAFGMVSRKHAIVELDARSGLAVVDMGSTNGTYVNGVRLDRSARSSIQVGDEVSFSKSLTGQIHRGTQ